MKDLLKSIIEKLIGWYVAPVVAQSKDNQQQLEQLKAEYLSFAAWVQSRQNLNQINLTEQKKWMQEQFARQEEKFSGIAEREQWARDRFAEQEEWVRQRFVEIQHHINGSVVNVSEGKPSFAQSGEDMIISYLLNFLQKPISEVTYLDLGANHAKELSNTYHFYQMGARGVLLEANPELIPELEQIRPRDIVLNRAVSLSQEDQEVSFYVLNGDGLSTIDYEEAKQACAQNPDLKITATYQIKTIQIQEIFETYFPQELTILSIDLEGIEEKLLGKINFEKYKPWIIVLENIPYRPTLSIDEREYKGLSLLERCGYTEYAFTGINSIFLRRDIVEQFNQKRMKELQGEYR